VTWIIIGVGAIAVLAIVVASWRRRQYVSDLGTVSAQWMSEQRMSAQHDSHR
jgi:FtsZ-interacting cell division protein ZipA